MRDRSKNKIELTLIRHGSTKGNEEKRYIGRTDESLSEKGIAIISSKKTVFNNCDLLFSSPMKRCIQTAEIIFPNVNPIIVDEMREMDFGNFEGKNYKELSDNKDYGKWVDSGCRGKIPGGEDLDGFVKRIMTGLEKCLKCCKEKNKKEVSDISATAIVHGGVIMAVLSSLTDNDFFDYQVKNGEGYLLIFEDDKLTSYMKI